MYDPARVPMPRLGREALADKPPHFVAADVNEPQLREIIARTYGMITLVDENIGRLLAALDETGLAENTVVVFTSDHGDLMGDCGLMLKGPWLLEGLVNVPMLWRLPGLSGGRRSSALFSAIDLAPTMLELLGIPTPPLDKLGASPGHLRGGPELAEGPRAMDGLAQADLLRGGHGRRDAAYIEFRTPQGDNLRSIITDSRKLTYYAGKDYGELYDLSADVPEAQNLYHDPAHAAERAALEKRLLDELILRDDYRLWPVAGA
jgi:arylsulfatase A-like enzyme